MANNQLSMGSTFVGQFNSSGGAATLAMNAAAKWLAYGFVAPLGNKTISNFLAFVSAITGTQANISVSCTIFSDIAGVPNAAISGAITLTNLAGNAWWTFSGLNQATTSNTRYWAVFKNTAVAPATDYPTFRWLTGMNIITGSTGSLWGDSKQYSADSGSTWASASSYIAGFRIDWSDSTYSGSPLSSTGTAYSIYGTREAGVVFTSPANATLKVAGAMMWISKVLNPTGTAIVRLRYGSSVVSATGIASGFSATQSYPVYFPSVVTIPPSTTCRLVLVDSAADDSSNYYRQQVPMTVHNDANSRGLLYLGAIDTNTTDNTANPIVWTDTNTQTLPFGLFLDTNQEYVAQVRFNRGMMGGCVG